MTREMLRYAGVNPRRLALEWISAAEGARFAQLMTEFDAVIRELGPFGASEEFEREVLDRKLDAAIKAAAGKKLRWVVGKYTEFTTEGNKYGEVFTRHEMNRTLCGIIKEEVDSFEIHGLLEKEPLSVKELAARLNMDPPEVLRYVTAMRKKQEAGLKEIKGNTPVYENLPTPASTEPRKKIKAAPAAREEVKTDKTAVVLGASPAGIEAALEAANSGSKVYLVDTTPGMPGKRIVQDEKFNGDVFAESRFKEAKEHPAIEIVPLATLRKAKTRDGKIELKFDTVPMRIEPGTCDDCGACFRACPISLWDAYDQELTLRTAVDRFSAESAEYNVVKEDMPICQATCPVHLDIRGYVGLIADGKHIEALERIRERLPFPSICGRVCAHPCEDACNRGKVDEPVAICALKRFVADCEMHECFDIEIKPPEKILDEKVAVVGGGPAGLACAHDLARLGYRCTVFEALPVAGGMLYVGIPEYRLPKKILGREVDMVRALGVEIKTGVRVGKDIPFDKLREDFDAIFMGIGCHKAWTLGVPGEDELDGVIDCVAYLRRNNLGEGVPVRDKLVVIGGGNAAIDVARVGCRLGYKEVHIVYRRTRKEMPANAWEIDEAEHEGVKITYLAAPVEVLGKDGKVTGIKCIKMELGEPDASGRRRPIPVEGSEFDIECDIVVPALSQTTDLEGLEEKGMDYTRRGYFAADEDTLETTLEGVFAGGDAVTGPGLAIEAIAQGKQAAIEIDRYLRSKKGE
jgi:NADPH-dependent glutamate synthase beta subunit-like oxidoreductase